MKIENHYKIKKYNRIENYVSNTYLYNNITIKTI